MLKIKNNIFKKLLLAIIFLIFSNTYIFSQESGFVEFSGRVKYYSKNIKDAQITVIKGNNKDNSILSDSEGKFLIKLDLDNDYMIIFSKSGFVTKKVQIITKVPENRKSNTWKTQTTVELFEKMPSVDVSALKKPVTIIKLHDDQFGGFFTFDQDYARRMAKELKRIKAQISKIKDEAARISPTLKKMIVEENREAYVGNTNKEEAKKEADSILQEAVMKRQEILENATNEAKTNAEEIKKKAIADANESVEKILKRIYDEKNKNTNNPKAEADRILRRAREEAKRIIDQARIKVNKMIKLANDSIASITSDNNAITQPISNNEITKELEKIEPDKFSITNLDSANYSANELEKEEANAIEKEAKLVILEKKVLLELEQIQKNKYQLQLDLLKAKTRKDSLLIMDKEDELIKKELELMEAHKKIIESREKIRNQILAIQKQFAELKYQKTLLILSFIILIILSGVFILLYRNYLNKQKANVILEEKNRKIELQNNNIFTSLNYASKIQQALLPASTYITKNLSNFFILFRPKEIVSGDFYWLEKLNSKIFFSAIDCTGHGVPGAFMSFIGNSALNQATKEYNITKPSEILDYLNQQVVNTLQKGGKVSVNDGMDMALCSLDREKKEIEFAGAYNPLYLIRKKGNPIIIDSEEQKSVFGNDNYELFEIKADRRSIGGKDKNLGKFTNYKFKVEKDDAIYIFSDGYTDQFGGEKKKKFRFQQFRKLLLSIYGTPMKTQEKILNKKIDEWRGEIEQMDDICIIGVTV